MFSRGKVFPLKGHTYKQGRQNDLIDLSFLQVYLFPFVRFVGAAVAGKLENTDQQEELPKFSDA